MPIAAGRITGLLRATALAVAALLVVAVGSPSLGFAHEPRTTGDGNYTMTVGFLNEPAYLGLENGLYVRVVQIGGTNDPVPDLQDTLQAEVIFGGDQAPLALAPLPDSPGAYVGRFIPTRTGDYTFRITGTIGDQQVTEEFRSSPDTFDSIQPASLVQFPEPVPAGSDLTAALSDAEDDAASARTLSYVGIGAGIIGTLLALVAIGLMTRRRSA